MELRQEQLKKEVQHQVAFGKCRVSCGEQRRRGLGQQGEAQGWALGERVSDQDTLHFLDRRDEEAGMGLSSL